MKPARPKILESDHQVVFHPLYDRSYRAFRNLEVYRFLGFALQNGSTLFDLTVCHHVDDFHLHKLAGRQLAVDRHVEQCQVAMVLGHFKSHADRPDMLYFSGRF